MQRVKNRVGVIPMPKSKWHASFGARLKLAREAAGYEFPADLAEAISRELGEPIKPGTIRSYERGDREPGLPFLIFLAEFLDVKLTWLISGPPNAPVPPTAAAVRQRRTR